MQNLYSLLPSVDECLKIIQERFPGSSHDVLKDACRNILDQVRTEIKSGEIKNTEELSLSHLIPRMITSAIASTKNKLCQVINGAGVIIHTNLGRSVLSEEAQEAVQIAASGYCNLEFNLTTGERGSRIDLVEGLLQEITGAEAGLVVNNNAAAVLLMLDSLCKGGEVILSRGQLVEIGGSFRIPDVMERSGAILKEVGTTNRTHLSDYQDALTENTKAILWVHPSNYRIIGFHSSVSPKELVEFAHSKGLPALEDLGSGSFIDFRDWGLEDEPTVQETIRNGLDVVTFSGDKVLGGPQAGIIVGKKQYIELMKKNQLLRALRCDKLTLAALEATLRLYKDTAIAREQIPTLKRITASAESVKMKAVQFIKGLDKLSLHAKLGLIEGFSRVGGGAFPEQGIATTLLRVEPTGMSCSQFREKLLQSDPPLIGRVENDCFLIDFRTIDYLELPIIERLFKEILSS